MRLDSLATAILVLLVLGVTFYAGYGWRMLVERRLHNMPWLKKSARKAVAAATQSTSPPMVLRSAFAQAEPLERQMLPEPAAPPSATASAAPAVASDTPTPSAPAVVRRRRKSPQKKIATREIKAAN